jgi:hypothetical protein
MGVSVIPEFNLFKLHPPEQLAELAAARISAVFSGECESLALFSQSLDTVRLGASVPDGSREICCTAWEALPVTLGGKPLQLTQFE